jgi:hypothetical protein
MRGNSNNQYILVVMSCPVKKRKTNCALAGFPAEFCLALRAQKGGIGSYSGITHVVVKPIYVGSDVGWQGQFSSRQQSPWGRLSGASIAINSNWNLFTICKISESPFRKPRYIRSV